MKAYIAKLKDKKNLTAQEMEEVMQGIMSAAVSPEEMAAFLLALRAKGPTIEEITAAARIMRQFAKSVKTRHKTILDTCGTGGDQKGTFNVSTVSALVVAACGVVVAKHGNRSISSQCGSADVLEALGVNLDLTAEQLGECLDRVGIAFLFAQRLHPAMKHVAAVRKKLGVETIFNILGPLTNPANATHQMVGVYDKSFVNPLAHVLKGLGLKRAFVVHGSDGLDEATITGASFVSEYNGHEIISYAVSPAEHGIKIAKSEDLTGGDLSVNTKIVRDILSGQKGPKRDMVVFNAACALYVAGAADSIGQGVVLAGDAIDAGKARQKLEELKEFTQKCKTIS